MENSFLFRLILGAVALLAIRHVLGSRNVSLSMMSPVEKALAFALGIFVSVIVFGEEDYLLLTGLLLLGALALLRALFARS